MNLYVRGSKKEISILDIDEKAEILPVEEIGRIVIAMIETLKKAEEETTK